MILQLILSQRPTVVQHIGTDDLVIITRECLFIVIQVSPYCWQTFGYKFTRIISSIRAKLNMHGRLFLVSSTFVETIEFQLEMKACLKVYPHIQNDYASQLYCALIVHAFFEWDNTTME